MLTRRPAMARITPRRATACRCIMSAPFPTVTNSTPLATAVLHSLHPPFDAHSYLTLSSGKPFETKIGVGQVIKGWDEGVPKMSLGEKAKLTITPYAHSHLNLRFHLQHG